MDALVLFRGIHMMQDAANKLKQVMMGTEYDSSDDTYVVVEDALADVGDGVDAGGFGSRDGHAFMVESDREILIVREELKKATLVSYHDAKRNQIPTIRLTLKTESSLVGYDVWFTFDNDADWTLVIAQLRAGSLWNFVNTEGHNRVLSVHGNKVMWKVD